MTHSHHPQLRCSPGVVSCEPFLPVTEERGPSAGAVPPRRLTPLTQVCLFRFRIRYCLPHFISFSIHPQVLASDPKVACHILGLHKVLPPLLFVFREIWSSACSVLVKFIADGCDATLWGFAMLSYHTTKLLLHCAAFPPIFRRVCSISGWCCEKGVLTALWGPPQLLQASCSLTFGSTLISSMTDWLSPTD